MENQPVSQSVSQPSSQQPLQQQSVDSSSAVPLPPQETLKYAGFWIRAVALWVDGFVLTFAGLIIGFIWGIVVVMMGFNQNTFTIFGDIIGIAITWIYFVWMTNSYQATLGKMLVGIKVQSVDGSKLTLGKIGLREILGKFISGILIYIGYIMAAFTDKKQALHDKLAESVVVYKDPSKKSNTGLIVGIVIVAVFMCIAIIGILSAIVLASLSDARAKGSDAETQVVIAQVVQDSLSYLGDKNTFSGFQFQDSQYQPAECTGPLTVNISPDGKSLAVFGKSCEDPTMDFCQSLTSDSQTLEPVDQVLASSVSDSKIDCSDGESVNQE